MHFKKPQHELSALMMEVAKEALFQKFESMAYSNNRLDASFGLQNLNRLKSCCMEGSGQVFKVIPHMDRSLKPADFQTWSKLRLGYKIFPSMTSCKYCGEISDEFGQHMLLCNKVRGSASFAIRHNKFRDVVAEIARECGCKTVVEASNIFDDSQERPADILISNEDTGLHLSVDVSLTSPHIASNNINSGVGNAAIVRHKKKVDKYGARCKEAGLTCTPVILEHYGGYTSYTESMLINGLASAWSKNSGLPFDFCKKNIKDRLSVEHAKIISNIFTSRLIYSDAINTVSFDHTMYDGSSGFRSWANANKVKKESISIIDEGKVGLNSPSQDDDQDEDWAMAANVAAAGDWANAETTAEWGADPAIGIVSGNA